MQRQLTYLFCFTSILATLCTFSYFLISRTFTLGTLESINFSLFALQTLLILPFFLALLIRFKLEYQESIRAINERIHSKVRAGIFSGAIVVGVFGYVSIFYEFFVKRREEGGLWSIEINIFLALATFVLYARTLIIERENRMLGNIIYIVLALLVIFFLAHLAIMTKEPIYSPELCLEILVLINLLDTWWGSTPIFLHIAMIVIDTITVEEFIREMVTYKLSPAILFYRIMVCLLVGTHLTIKGYQMVGQISKCFREFYDDECKDTPLSNIMISQIPIIPFKDIRTRSKGEGSKAGVEQASEMQLGDGVEKGSCVICTMGMEEETLVYEIPCSHGFHTECLGKWLQLRNSCPTCRKPAI